MASSVRRVSVDMGVVACGVGPLVGRVRSRTGSVKRDTFLRAESPGTFTLWGPQKGSRTGGGLTCRPSPRCPG